MPHAHEIISYPGQWWASGLEIPTPAAHFWLNESGNAVNQVSGGIGMTDINTVALSGSAHKIAALGFRRDWDDANSEQLATSTSPGSPFNAAGQNQWMMGLWIAPGASSSGILSMGIASNAVQYELYMDGSEELIFRVFGSDNNQVNAATTTANLAVDNSTWYCVMPFIDLTNDLMGFYLNGTLFSTAYTKADVDSPGTDNFRCGYAQGGATPATKYWDGSIALLTIWPNQILTANQRSLFYNGRGTAAGAYFNGSVWLPG